MVAPFTSGPVVWWRSRKVKLRPRHPQEIAKGINKLMNNAILADVAALAKEAVLATITALTGGFFEWTGQEWALVRGGAPGERGVLWGGEVTLAGDLPRWKPPADRYLCEQRSGR